MIASDLDLDGFDRMHLADESPIVLVRCDGCGATGHTADPAGWRESHEHCAGGSLFEVAS